MTNETHLVAGAGPLGLAVARALQRRGSPVRVVTRSGRASVPDGVDVMAADFTNRSDARRICRSAAVIYHCAATPYGTWPRTLPPIMDGIIYGAATSGARLVYGDNLYCYGPVNGRSARISRTDRSGQMGESVPSWPKRCWPRTRPGRFGLPSDVRRISSARMCGSRS